MPPSAPLFLDVAGAVNFDSTLNVIGASTLLSLLSVQLASNAVSIETRITGEANPLFSVDRDGKLSWGIGGSNITDTFLYRSAAGTLRTSGSLTVDSNLLISGNSTLTGNLNVNGNTVLGNAISDTVSFAARINSDFVPTVDNSYDLGLSGFGWKNLFVSGSVSLGSSLTDTIILNGSIASSLIPLTDNAFTLGTTLFRWSEAYIGTLFSVYGNTILGDATSDTVTVNARINSDITPSTNASRSLGSASLRWQNLYLSTLFNLEGNAVFGDASTDTVTFNSSINSNFIPSADLTYDLGSLTNRWQNIYGSGSSLSGDLSVSGNTVLGDANTDTLTVNARINSDLIPNIDNTYDLGSSSLRWKTLHVGPGSLVVHNDATNTVKFTIGFSGSVASLTSDSSTPVQIAAGLSNGIFINTSGLVGVNNLSPSRQLDVIGSGSFSDTLFAAKNSGIGLVVESDVTVKGSLEADVANKILNIGITSNTEFINIGTGPSLQTINIGTSTGPTIINIGSAGDSVYINGTTFFSSTVNTSVYDKTFTLNAGGAAGSAPNSGIYVEEAAVATLVATSALWQAGTKVRYAMVNTGNIAIGSTVTISGFANAANNGTFGVTFVSSNAYIDVTSTRTNASLNETATGAVTNPVNVASIYVNSLSNGWDFTSPAFPTFSYSFRNTGADTIFTSSASGLVIAASGNAILPGTPGDNLGSPAARWDVYAATLDVAALNISGNLSVDGNTTLGNTSADIVTFNAVPYFINKIGSDLIPLTSGLNIGSSIDRWQDLFISGSADIDGSVDVAVNATIGLDLIVNGNTTLGDASSDLISLIGSVATPILPSSNATYNLGSSSFTWASIYGANLYLSSLNTGSILFAGLSGFVSQNNNQFFWDNTSLSLGLGTNTPSKQLELLRATSAPTIKMSRTDTSHGIGFYADAVSRIQHTGSLLFSSVNASNLATSSGGIDSISIGSNGSVSLFGALAFTYGSAVAANTYSVSSTDTVIPVNTASGSITANCTITLPSASVKRILVIKDIGNNCSAVNKNIILTPASGEFVEFGIANETFIMDTDGMSLTLHSDGVSRWFII